MSEWQPIETAPKDGTRTLLFRDGWAESMSVGYYDSSLDEWVVAACGNVFIDPTYWMPRPDPPTEAPHANMEETK